MSGIGSTSFPEAYEKANAMKQGERRVLHFCYNKQSATSTHIIMTQFSLSYIYNIVSSGSGRSIQEAKISDFPQ